MSTRQPHISTLGVEALERRIAQMAQRGAHPTYTSRGRRFTFYWFRSGKRLAVKIHKRQPLAHLPAVEALAQKLNALWSCPECGVAVERRGKRKFCTPAHAARFRKKRWRRAQVRKKGEDAKREQLVGFLQQGRALPRRPREKKPKPTYVSASNYDHDPKESD